ncbi:hypothetical protein [Ornithinibacillus contaminans]|uniref:hypothetical protein n=1 Tax=Ornithinibacillus contaminans TaxID=694055 RepID=UPI00064DEA4C|nr:hypothetical protein [Ornithinibacillus contaminans]
MSLKDKYKRPVPQEAPKRKGSSDVLEKIVKNDNQSVLTEKKVKKATFELSVDLHKRLRTHAALNDTTMLEIVENALNEYLDNQK